MAVPAPARSLPGAMPGAPSSLTGPAIGPAGCGTGEALRITGVVPGKSAFHRTLQSLDAGDGCAGRRTVKITAVAAGLAFPHAARAIQIVRRRLLNGKNGKKWCTETVYAHHLADRRPGAARRARRHHRRPPGRPGWRRRGP
jgi:hypothetical protein